MCSAGASCLINVIDGNIWRITCIGAHNLNPIRLAWVCGSMRQDVQGLLGLSDVETRAAHGGALSTLCTAHWRSDSVGSSALTN